MNILLLFLLKVNVYSSIPCMVGRGKSITLDTKVQIISRWLTGPKNKADIARIFHTSENTVHKWISRWENTHTLDRQPGQGRKCALDKKACKRAFQLLIEEHQSAGAAAKRLLAEGLAKTAVHKSTLIRHVKQYAKEQHSPISAAYVKPKKRLTTDNKRQRYDFCRKHRHDTFTNVMFTDRCNFHFRHPGEAVQTGHWHVRGAGPQVFTVNHADVFNVYAGITIHGTTRVWVVSGTTGHHPVKQYFTKKHTLAKNITAAEYVDVLLHILLPWGHILFGGHDWVLQQDNDPTHIAASAKVVKRWNQSLKDQGKHTGMVTLIEDWPPNSPDLSIIENVWSIVQNKADAAGCKDFSAFKAKVEEEIDQINPGPLFASIPRRIKACIKAKGDRTKH
jgi:transposase